MNVGQRRRCRQVGGGSRRSLISLRAARRPPQRHEKIACPLNLIVPRHTNPSKNLHSSPATIRIAKGSRCPADLRCECGINHGCARLSGRRFVAGSRINVVLCRGQWLQVLSSRLADECHSMVVRIERQHVAARLHCVFLSAGHESQASRRPPAAEWLHLTGATVGHLGSPEEQLNRLSHPAERLFAIFSMKSKCDLFQFDEVRGET
jgi:hypothetical protein